MLTSCVSAHPSGMCNEFEQILLVQDSSAMMRDRHAARSLVKVALERLPGSAKIFCMKV